MNYACFDTPLEDMCSTAHMNHRRAEGTSGNSNFERVAAPNVDMKVADPEFGPEEGWDTTELQYSVFQIHRKPYPSFSIAIPKIKMALFIYLLALQS